MSIEKRKPVSPGRERIVKNRHERAGSAHLVAAERLARERLEDDVKEARLSRVSDGWKGEP